ncbi:MAG: radical SAM protein, partial [Candidatus Omnitrophota bacterium]
QFQYFKEPTFIYPVVPASAATLLKETGLEVKWLDCIAEGISKKDFFRIIKEENPDLIAMETKTPVIKQQWQLINELKTYNVKLKTVLFGDHVTALTQESFDNSKVDFILTGGDYDFLFLNLCQNLKNRTKNFEPGIWYREEGQVKNTGKFKLDHDLNTLPLIDRDLTKWQLYAYKNGNYRRRPGTYIMSGRDCWWGRCSFCSWPQLYPQFRVRKADNVLDEIEQLITKYKVKEIMDDTGAFPVGGWLQEFCKGMIKRGLNRRVNLNCNMRLGAVNYQDYKLMRKASFRFLLFGLESANQKTLDKINKNLRVETIIKSCKEARRAGLYPHITVMFGYPWETYQDARKTLELGKWLLQKDYAYTMQATIVIPYPGASLFNECQRQDLLQTLDWDYYDMKNPVMKLPFPAEKLLDLVQSMYSVSFYPEFILRKILSIRGCDDIKYFSRAFFKVLGHLVDFRRKRCKCDKEI